MKRPRGSVLLLALLLIAVAGLLTAGAVGVLYARSGLVAEMETATQRRIALENSRALAQEFMLRRVMTSSSGSAFTYQVGDGSWGAIAMPAWSAAPLRSVQKSAGVNLFAPGNGDGYTLDVSATLSDGASTHPRLFQARSRSPLLAGTLLANQTPTLAGAATSTTIGPIDVDGGAFVWRPQLAMTCTPDRYSAPDISTNVTFVDSAGTILRANNLALPLQIANPRPGFELFYGGQFDAIDNADPAANSARQKVTAGGYVLVDGNVADTNDLDCVVCDGAGVVTITLSTPDPAKIEPSYVYIPGEITTLVLVGQPAANDAAADDASSALVVVNQAATSSRNLSQVTLQQHNHRRLVLAIKKQAVPSTGVTVQFPTTAAAWRLLLEAENTPLAFSAAGTATLRGGLRSDRSLTLAAGSLRLLDESDPKFLDQLATRTAWVESFAP